MTEDPRMTDRAPEFLPMEALPLSIGFAVEYLDGVMSAEQAEIQRMWKIVRAHMLTRPTPAERPVPQVREVLDKLADKISAKVNQLQHYRDHECQLDHARTIAEGRLIQAQQILQWVAEAAVNFTALNARPSDPAATFTDTEWHDALMGTPKARPSDAAVAWQYIDMDGKPGLVTTRPDQGAKWCETGNGRRLYAIPHEEAVREAKLVYVKRWRTIVSLPAIYADEIVEALRSSPTVASERVSERETEHPRVTDDDKDSITVTFNGRELRGWSYASDAERRVKMTAAREYVEGWCDGRQA